MNKQLHPSYRADIDGLRAIAVVSVLGYHAFPTVIPGGFIGVDIFFVISGFLISSIIICNLQHENFLFLEFYGRRIKRIFPALLLVLWSCLLFGYAVLTPDELTQLGKHVAGGSGFIANIVLMKESGYFNSTAEAKPLLHLWSLGIEEQYYILWPLILWFGWQKRLGLLTIIVALTLGSFLLNIVRVEHHPVGTFYLPQTRVWELMIGSIAAYVSLQQKQGEHTIQDALLSRLKNLRLSLPNIPILSAPNLWSIVGVSLIVLSLALIKKTSLFPGWWALLPTAGAAILIVAGPQAWLNNRLLGHPILRGVGLISFPLYLWHWPLLSFARILEGQLPSIAVRSAAVALSVILAWLTFRFIEKPVRFGRQKPWLAIQLSALMLITGLAGYLTLYAEGFPVRLNNSHLVSLFAKYPHAPFHNEACDQKFPAFKNLSACLLSSPNEPNVVIVGDSHSNQYFKAFSVQLPGASVLNVAEWSCLPFATDDLMAKGDCSKKMAVVQEELVRNQVIKQVYIAGYWSYLLSGKFEIDEDNWRRPMPYSVAQQAAFLRKAEDFIGNLITAGKEVILIQQIPDLDFNVRSCYNFRPITLWKSTRISCTTDRLENDQRSAGSASLISGLQEKFPSLKVVNPREVLCDSHECRATQDGEPLYFNGDHLSLLGADIVVRAILEANPATNK